LKKRNKKLLIIKAHRVICDDGFATDKSFLFLFFKKEMLSSFLSESVIASG